MDTRQAVVTKKVTIILRLCYSPSAAWCGGRVGVSLELPNISDGRAAPVLTGARFSAKLAGMEWAKPKHSKGQIDRASRVLIDESVYPWAPAYETALEVINNYRAVHYYPLNTFKVTLRRKAEQVDPDRIVAQRIKRMSSIGAKLKRFPTLRMSQMQDVGGCRAIVGTSRQVTALVKLYNDSDLKHVLDDVDDYIEKPQASGYRGVHMIYKYFSDKQAPSIYNGLYIEVQLRSRLQHAWATAVETIGTFLSQALKSSQGEEEWLRFFALASGAIAVREKSSARVPGTPHIHGDLIEELRDLATKLNAENTLRMYSNALTVGREQTQKGNHYFLLKLEPSSNRMTIQGFPRKDLERASASYLAVEKQIIGVAGSEAVLVSVDSLVALERAYPNYFLDTTVFLSALQEALK
jgi:ppGpp synthetase/RelA/SpoT-type nucleotidyltranferase